MNDSDTVAVIDFETTGMSPAMGARATEIYTRVHTLSLHDALPIFPAPAQSAVIAGYGEHLQRRLGVFGRDERA